MPEPERDPRQPKPPVPEADPSPAGGPRPVVVTAAATECYLLRTLLRRTAAVLADVEAHDPWECQDLARHVLGVLDRLDAWER